MTNDTTRDTYEAWLDEPHPLDKMLTRRDYMPKHDGGFNFLAWQAATLKANQWRPIADAPKDATAILVMRDIWPGTKSGRAEDCNGHNTYVAAWWANENGNNGEWICYMNAVLDPDCPIEPTHWQPLPLPPTATPQGNL